jgi:hypothetical protein
MKKFASQMRKLNDEQRIIEDDILYKEKKIQQNHYTIFNRRSKNKKNIYINVHHTKHVTILYKRNYKC